MSTAQMYTETILDHYRSPRNYGELAGADVQARERNPLCGDEVTLYMSFDGERRLRDIRFTGRGCVLTMATASMLSERLVGKPASELQAVDEAQLLEMLAVEVLPVRRKCVNLSLEVLRSGLAQLDRGAGERGQAADPEPSHAHGLLDHIGGTPLLQLRSAAWGLPPGVQLFAKLEAMNPGGTVKARSVLWILRDALQSTQHPLLPGMAILDVMTGSSGIAIALIGAQMGFPTKLIVPASVSDDAKRVLRAYGAQLHVLVDPGVNALGAAEIARETQRKDPKRIYHLDLFNHPAASNAHHATTGAEILAQTGQRVTHFVAGVGTGATLAGVASRLKEHDRSIQVLGVVPSSAAERIEGLRPPGPTARSTLLDASILDGTLEVTARESEERTRQLAKREGLLVGTSSGAALAASLRLAGQLDEATIVTVFPDDGQRYLGDPHWLNDY
ncbi:MAG TPA: pyridoxal-phosphate dependent enzyme [Kofleriaceae bacterium]|nr:pyridoxal-phosphate dependent enzyme [Kofleriaceae bacterium]